MKLIKSFAMILSILALCASAQAVSMTIGSGNYYVSVGDNDYLPYAYGPGYQPTGISFQATMADYGQWTQMQPFGQVWQPYVAQGWRPYTQGHWVYTQYGPTWVGYEPWAWAGYHYGNWVFSQQLGWVWIPGNTYSPGNVAWAQGYNSLGWMPMPPAGYDYSRGYLAYAGPQNQFTIGSSDFSIGVGFGGGGYYQGGPYYDPRYRDMYYNSNYINAAGNLWTFIDPNYFGNDNYADYYIGGDYAQQMFNQRVVRISTQPLDRVVVERIVRQPVPVRQIEVNQINVDGRPTRLVRVQGEDQDVRKNANRVVREVIAPGFAEKGRAFKGPQAKGQANLNRVLNQGEATPKVETIDSDQIVRQARENRQQQDQRRAEVKQKKIDEVQTAVKEGKIRQPNTPPGQLKKEEDTRRRNSQVNPQTPPEQNRPDVERQQPERNKPDVNQPDNTNEDQQNTSRDNRPADRRTNENMNRPDKPTEEQQKNNQNNRDKNHPEQVPPDRQVTPPDHPDHSNMQPDSDQNQNQRDENAVKNGKENPDKNANAKDEKQSDKDKSKKKKTNKDKDKNNENPDQPPPER